MVLPQRIIAEENVQFVPPMLAAAAAAYQRARIAEREQLETMGRHDLMEAWSDEVRTTVLQARARILETQAARLQLRDQVRDLVATMRNGGDSVPAVLRHTRSMIQVLEPTPAALTDRADFESELLAWVIEDCESQ